MLERLRRKRGYDAKQIRDLHFDALIALTACAVGALVITCNGDDFRELCREEPFRSPRVEYRLNVRDRD